MWAATTRPLSYEEMVVVEQNAVALGVSLDVLMENAGRVVAEEAARHLPPGPSRVAVVCSTGNNGGDGTCAAHYLKEWGFVPEVWLVRPATEIRSRAARRCFERYARSGGKLHVGLPSSADLAAFPLVVDALLGTGQTDRLRSPIREAALAVRQSGAPVLAVDLPTGARDPDGIRASWTVALTALKREMDPRTAGDVSVREIGIPEAAWRRTGPGEFAAFRRAGRGRAGGRSHRVLVVGGGPYAGAPALTALAALRAGAERATVFAPAGVAGRVQGFSPNLVVRPFGTDLLRVADVPPLLEAIRGQPPSAVGVGMGAGADPATIEAFAALYRELVGRVPIVVDADALNIFASPDAFPRREHGAPVVATPNTGEFSRLFAPGRGLDLEGARVEVARSSARRGITLLAKGDPDILSDGELTVENHHHPPGMAVAGAGDVLAGVLLATLGAGVEAVPAARLAAYWTGEAGMLAASRFGYGLVATDLIDQLGPALVDGLARVAPSDDGARGQA